MIHSSIMECVFSCQKGTSALRSGGLEPADIEVSVIRGFLADLHRQRISASSSGRKLSALRTFIRYLRREELVDNNPSALVSAPKQGVTIPSHLTVDEMNRRSEIARARWPRAICPPVQS